MLTRVPWNIMGFRFSSDGFAVNPRAGRSMAQKDKTLADFLAIAMSPVLIMALVGSLVFFLLEVLYQGKHQGSLQWILFFFVFGAVLIARISMEGGIAERAAGYGFILGLLVWL